MLAFVLFGFMIMAGAAERFRETGMKKFLSVIAVLLVAVTGYFIYQVTISSDSLGEANEPQELEYLVIHQPAQSIAPFHLTTHQGEALGLAQLKGRWSIMFLGYTFCPDICPTTLAMLKSAYGKLNDIHPVQIIFVSADPQRDSPQRLNQYINYFHPEFIAATGPHADLYPLTRNLGLAYAMFDGDTPENYLVDHSASIVLINPEGELQATFRPMPSPHGYVPTVQAKQLITDYSKVIESLAQ